MKQNVEREHKHWLYDRRRRKEKN